MFVAFFVIAIGSYITHGMLRDTTNQFEHTDRSTTVAMTALIVGEMGGFFVLLAGFVWGGFLGG